MKSKLLESKIDLGRIIHSVTKLYEHGHGRYDISSPEELLQASIVSLPSGKNIQPHIHLPRIKKNSELNITQEGWLILRGRIKVKLYDLDKSFICEEELSQGSLLLTFGGGHGFESIEENTLLMEFKNGPYLGKDYQAF